MADQGPHRQIARRPWRRVVYVLIWLMALAAPVGAIGYLLYANLLNPRATEQLTGTYDGFYWDAAQLQIAYARFENQLLLYQSGADDDYQRLLLRFQLLQSKLRVMAGSTQRLSTQLALLQRQIDEIKTLEDVLDDIQPEIDVLPRDRTRAARIDAQLRQHWSDVNDLALSRRFADVADREAMNRDFIDKRRMLFAGGLVLLLLSAAATLLLVLNGRRRTRLMRQQRAALEAEHQASRAAREASLAKDAFLGMISHELRTPLHAIVSSVELLGFHYHSEADRKVIQRLETAARHLEAQMKDLTDYARLGAGKLELRHQHFEPRELLASIVDEHTMSAKVRGLKLESEASGASGLVESDPHRIRQIVNNLVTNAIRYTETGTVRVELRQQPALLVFVVSDTGPGVPSEQIPLIFEEFTQLDAKRSRRFEGAGMGLTIVQGLVKLFGGTVDVASTVGEGTRFTVTIPVVPVATVEPADVAAQTEPDGAQPCVLIIDDNSLIRESLSEMVAHMGYDSLALGNANDALEWLDTHRCEVVLLDLHMPERDGYTFLEDFAARGGPSAGVPVIVVSAYAPEIARDDEGGGSGAPSVFEALLKPVHYEDLKHALQRALAARHQA
ncbi:signal transduction histidine kinase/ActR/RegA family two-component response regulator [Paraburkholderia sp. JPY158]|uniref:Virulence sensor protein BvgS n=1 Tax=Paraburkholderia atlantica TaxID=2654982 RepID=A0A7W8VA36_PARAM|nr:ATP-binding protein [Paraburkholderia atlantica]MBB5428469.1 signal transduction histidine kinase/ActR/RegA family two-component response regulator [Paraburkholderia atlantica]